MLRRMVFATVALLALPVWAMSAATPEEVQSNLAKAVAVEAKAQASYGKWTDAKAGIADDIRDMKAMDEWLEFQSNKYLKYIEKQKSVIAELERRKEEAQLIRMRLEPFLADIVDALEDFVEADLPFLSEERKKRIYFLRASLDDYRLSLSEKLRQVFEALLIETEYGRNVATTTRELDLNGSPTQVSVFRLGRTALFYQAADGSAAGIWDKSSASWVSLDHEYVRTLRRARDMAERKRSVELLELPIGAMR
ncbi:DUF3450 domain-containing protein [Pseudodesulfovibrio nedwellii]|uniref:DUF3450 domain-containing protein n=1 Tax=Pseudodesulfovibrio nedwellii TaxID=2973072 RepID=A0ABM8AWG0_9BACT|nr:DUF3450 domain-containing protein [Pseudodesulfovibrio nedwellii]BDQ35872.1 DUF3450 domain-containing protein [Pseudodesulfovibrio nedwellii]